MGQCKSISYSKLKECELKRSTFQKVLDFFNLSYFTQNYFKNVAETYKQSSCFALIIQDGKQEEVANVKMEGHYNLIGVYTLQGSNDLTSLPLLLDKEIKVIKQKSLPSSKAKRKRAKNEKISTNKRTTPPKLTVHVPKKIKFCQHVSLVEFGQKESITSLNKKESSFQKRLAKRKYFDLIDASEDASPRELTRTCKRRVAQPHVRETVKKANLELFSVEGVC